MHDTAELIAALLDGDGDEWPLVIDGQRIVLDRAGRSAAPVRLCPRSAAWPSPSAFAPALPSGPCEGPR